MQLCNILLYLSVQMKPTFSDPVPPPVDLQQFVVDGQNLFRFFHMHLPPRPSMPVHSAVHQLDCKFFSPSASFGGPTYGTIIGISTFRTDSRCSAQGCINSIQSVRKHFQRCASFPTVIVNAKRRRGSTNSTLTSICVPYSET